MTKFFSRALSIGLVISCLFFQGCALMLLGLVENDPAPKGKKVYVSQEEIAPTESNPVVNLEENVPLKPTHEVKQVEGSKTSSGA